MALSTLQWGPKLGGGHKIQSDHRLKVEHVLSSGIVCEPQLMILALSVNDPLPDLPKFLQNGYLGLGTRYGDERRIILKPKTCTFT